MSQKVSLIPCASTNGNYACNFMDEFYKIFPTHAVKTLFKPTEYNIIASDFCSFYDMGGDPWEFESLRQR